MDKGFDFDIGKWIIHRTPIILFEKDAARKSILNVRLENNARNVG